MAVLERDAWTCGDCGRKGARFEVHHVDGNRENNAIENLITLCRGCHQLRHYRPPPAGRDDWDTYLAVLSADKK